MALMFAPITHLHIFLGMTSTASHAIAASSGTREAKISFSPPFFHALSSPAPYLEERTLLAATTRRRLAGVPRHSPSPNLASSPTSDPTVRSAATRSSCSTALPSRRVVVPQPQFWARYFDVLDPEHPRLRGRGAPHRGSPPRSRSPSITWSGRLHTYLDQFVQTPPYHLVSSSLGGKVAVEFAVRYPQLVNRVVLLCPSGMGDKEQLPIMEGVRRKDMHAMVNSVFHKPRSSTASAAVLQGAVRQPAVEDGLAPAVSGTLDHTRPRAAQGREVPDAAGDRRGGQVCDPKTAEEAARELPERPVPDDPAVRPRPADRKALADQPPGRTLPQCGQADRPPVVDPTSPRKPARAPSHSMNPHAAAVGRPPQPNPNPPAGRPAGPDWWLMMKAFCTQGRTIASFAPSSRFMARKIVDGIDCDTARSASSNSGPAPGRSRPSWSSGSSRTRELARHRTRPGRCAPGCRPRFPHGWTWCRATPPVRQAARRARHPASRSRPVRAAAAVVPGRAARRDPGRRPPGRSPPAARSAS